MRQLMLLSLVAFFLSDSSLAIAQAQVEEAPQEKGVAERFGERLDRGVERLGRELRQSWAEIRRSVDELGVQGRVYSRLRWDKEIGTRSIDVEVTEREVVVLSGTLPDDQTRRKAVQLARDTVGVREVVDRLEIQPPRDEEGARSAE